MEKWKKILEKIQPNVVTKMIVNVFLSIAKILERQFREIGKFTNWFAN